MTRNDSPFSEKGEQMLELLTDFAEDGGPLIDWDELSKTRWCPHHPQTVAGVVNPPKNGDEPRAENRHTAHHGQPSKAVTACRIKRILLIRQEKSSLGKRRVRRVSISYARFPRNPRNTRVPNPADTPCLTSSQSHPSTEKSVLGHRISVTRVWHQFGTAIKKGYEIT